MESDKVLNKHCCMYTPMYPDQLWNNLLWECESNTNILSIHITCRREASALDASNYHTTEEHENKIVPMKLKHVQGSHIHSLSWNIDAFSDKVTCHLNRWGHPFSKTASQNTRGKENICFHTAQCLHYTHINNPKVISFVIHVSCVAGKTAPKL